MIACFISSHGFGHAARAAAVMSALAEMLDPVHFDIFTRIPKWFFEDSLPQISFDHHPILTDIGLSQETPMQEDIGKTLKALDRFYPLKNNEIQKIAETLKRKNSQLVICDIAPMGIAVAKAAGIPSVLVENFTWDWIYQGYEKHVEAFAPFITYLENLFASADIHIQTEPICRPAKPDFRTGPISRKPRTAAKTIRRQLGISESSKMVMITMGGIPVNYRFHESLSTAPGSITFVIPGAADKIERKDNFILLPHRSRYYHPDLIHSCDLVMGKAGYSTIAEIYTVGIPYVYVSRKRFRESPVLERFIDANIPGSAISEEAFIKGAWMADLDRYLSIPPNESPPENRADRTAEFICRTLNLKE